MDGRDSLEILLLVLLGDSDFPAVGLEVMLLNLAQDLKVGTEVQLQPTVLYVVLPGERHRQRSHQTTVLSDVKVDTDMRVYTGHTKVFSFQTHTNFFLFLITQPKTKPKKRTKQPTSFIKSSHIKHHEQISFIYIVKVVLNKWT